MQVDPRDDKDLTPLHAAASGGHVDAIRRLLSLNHDLECRDKTGASYVPPVTPGLLRFISLFCKGQEFILTY